MAKVVVEMGSDEQKLFAGMQRLIAQQSNMEESFKKTGRAANRAGQDVEEAGRKGGQAFGAKSVQDLKDYATGLMGVSAAAAAAVKVLKEYQAERQQAAAGIQAALPASAALAQMAGGDPANLKRLMNEVRASRKDFGYSAEEAAALQFSLENMGLGKERGFFGGFRRILADPGLLAESAGTVQAAFGEGEAGDIRQIVNKVLAGAALSKGTVEGFGKSSSMSAQALRSIGGTDEEQFGTLAVLSKALKSADVASTQIQSLARTIQKHGAGGTGLLAGIEKLDQQITQLPTTVGALTEAEKFERSRDAGLVTAAERKMAAGKSLSEKELSAWKRELGYRDKLKPVDRDSQLIEFFGSSEAMSAYSAIKLNRGEIQKAIAEIDREGKAPAGSDLSSRMKGSLQGVPFIQAALRADVAEQSRKIALEEGEGVQQLNRQTAIQLMAEQDYRLGRDPVERLLSRGVSEGLDLVGASDRTIRGTRSLGGGGTYKDVVRAIEQQTQKMIELESRKNRPTLGAPDDDR